MSIVELVEVTKALGLYSDRAQQKRLGPTQEKICTMHRMPTANRLLASQTKYDNRINHDVPISQPRHGQNLALPPWLHSHSIS
eukprot:scaffold52776_cov71-Cyclotella_meneghiniana.AAC.2